MPAKDLTIDDSTKLGVLVREAKDGNLLVGSFAAELIGECYPLSISSARIVFKSYADSNLGRKFAEWCDKTEEPPK